MGTFYKLLEKSVITSGALALMLGGTVCYCAIAGLETPPVIVGAFGTVVGFFFSQKASEARARIEHVGK